MVLWKSDSSEQKGAPTSDDDRIYIPMNGAGFLFQMPSGIHYILGARASLATAGLATCVGLILFHEPTSSGMISHFTGDQNSPVDCVNSINNALVATSAIDASNIDYNVVHKGPAFHICREMITKFETNCPDFEPEELQAVIYYMKSFVYQGKVPPGRISAEDSTNNLVAQLRKVLQGTKYNIINGSEEGVSQLGADIYINLKEREAGIYEETIEGMSKDGAPDDPNALFFNTFPPIDNFEYYVLENNTLRLVYNKQYLPKISTENPSAGSDDANSADDDDQKEAPTSHYKSPGLS